MDAQAVSYERLWEAAVKAEMRRYQEAPKGNTCRPGKLCKEQLRLAAQEALRRDEQEDTSDLNYVLVAEVQDDTGERVRNVLLGRNRHREALVCVDTRW